MKTDSTAMVVYSGAFERSLDTKNRVTIPARWLARDGEEFHVVPNPAPSEPFLLAMPPEEFALVESRILALDAPAEEKRKFIRQFYGAAQPVTVDKQGRILLPEEHCREAGLKSEVTLVGGKSRFEIWNRERWNKAASSDLPTYQKVAKLIGL